MSPVAEPEVQQTSTINVNRAAALVVTKHYLGTGKSVKSSSLDIKLASAVESVSLPEKRTDSAWLYVSKLLLNSKTLNAVYAADDKVLMQIERLRVPSPLKGTKLFPAASTQEIDSVLDRHQKVDRPALIEAFLASYASDIQAAIPYLGDLFSAENYPPVEVARENFSFEWKWIQFSISTELEDGIQQLLRASLAELVTDLSDRLTPDATGKKKIFRKESLNGIRDFLDTFDARNIANDAELKSCVETIRKLTDGVSPTDIQSNEAIRDVVKAGFADIQTTMGDMIVEAPRRRVKF